MNDRNDWIPLVSNNGREKSGFQKEKGKEFMNTLQRVAQVQEEDPYDAEELHF